MLGVDWLRVPLLAGLVIGGGACAVAAAYLLVLAVAALAPPGRRRAASHLPGPCPTVAVVVPAHNEADYIERCIASLRAQSYPHDRYEILVVADNCTDDTALRARHAGASVLVRACTTARGKGHALAFAMGQLLTSASPPDAFVVVDADSVAEPALLSGLVRCMVEGAEAVQGEYLVLPEAGSARDDLRSAAFLLFHTARFAGRAALGLPCSLVGNGMLFTRGLLERQPWTSFSMAEDLEYTIGLRLAGVRPAFARGAVVRGPVAASGRNADVQRARWEGGRLRIARTALPRLLGQILGRRRWSLVDVAVDLAVPPLGLLAAIALSGTLAAAAGAATGMAPAWVLAPWALALGGIAGFVLIGLHAAGAPRSLYRSLLWSPAFVARKVLGSFAVVRSARRDVWVRTGRPSESA
jgi:cellulose synthase/poly-beta-1,6-N-acetylglucosamine synthase-like glycosyltransferase